MNKRKKMTPAEVVIDLFGVRPLAAELRISPTTVLTWRDSEGGIVNAKHHAALLALAKSRGLPLSAEDLVYGR